MSGPHRLPPTADGRFGTLIDREEPVGFRFAGRSFAGFYGDTLASALAAHPPRWPASPLLGRPRAFGGLGLEDATPVIIDDDAGAFAAVSADDVPIREGLAARPARGGVERSFGRLAPRLLIERLRRVLPLPAPRLPTIEPEIAGRVETCDVVVVGAGITGLAAASALRAAGLDVRVLDAAARAGGAADLFDGTVDGKPLGAWAERQAAGLLDRGLLTLGATAVAIEPDGGVLAIDRADPRKPGRVSAKLFSSAAVVIATGFRERPLVFRDNDRPGIVPSLATRALLRRYAVAPGERVVVATLSDDGYRTALDLKDAGVTVEMVIDAREELEGAAPQRAMALGVPVSLATIVTGVDYDERESRVAGVRVANRFGEGASVRARLIEADALVVAGGFAPRDELLRRSGLSRDNGVFWAADDSGPTAAIAAGWAAGVAAARHLFVEVTAEAPVVEAVADEPDEPPIAYLEQLSPEDAASAFVDVAAEVTAADMAEAIRLGADGADALSRRLGLGLGGDGGRFSADLPAHAFAAAGGRGEPQVPAPARVTLGFMAARAALRES